MLKQGITENELSAYLGIPIGKVRQLTRKKIFSARLDGYDLDASLKRYVAFAQTAPIHSMADIPCIRCKMPPGAHNAIVWSRMRSGLLIMDVKCPFCHAEYKRYDYMDE